MTLHCRCCAPGGCSCFASIDVVCWYIRVVNKYMYDCIFTVSNFLLISCIRRISRDISSFWLKIVVMVLFTQCNYV